MSTYRGVNAGLAKCLNSVLNVKALVGTFNKKKALVRAFSVIVKTDGSFVALIYTSRPTYTKVETAAATFQFYLKLL